MSLDIGRVLSEIPIGKENARTGRQIANILGEKDTRQMRNVIRELIHGGWPICSTPHPPYGYYMANSQEEVTEALKIIRHYGLELFHHYHDLKCATRIIREPGQLPMTGLNK